MHGRDEGASDMASHCSPACTEPGADREDRSGEGKMW